MNTKLTLKTFDLANYIETKEDLIEDISLALRENDYPYLMEVLSAFSRSQNFTKIAAELGISRQGLYQALSAQGNPSFVVIMKLINTLGIGLKPYPLAGF